MKTILRIALCLCLLAVSADARMGAVAVGGQGVAVVGSSCPGSETVLLDVLNNAGDYYFAGYDTTTVFLGQGSFAPATDFGGSKTICSVGVGIRTTSGDVSGINWRVEIYAMSSVNLGSAPSGTCVSDQQVISGSYPIGEVKFTGLSCVLESGTTYGVAITRSDHSYNSTNFVQVFVGSTTPYSGSEMEWQSDKARADDNSADVSLKFYGY